MPFPHLLEQTVLALLPAGGQATARRNAWAAMSSDAVRARARREAAAALAQAVAVERSRLRHPSRAALPH